MTVFFIVLWHFTNNIRRWNVRAPACPYPRSHTLKRIWNGIFFIGLLYKCGRLAGIHSLHSAHMFYTRLYMHWNGWRSCLCMCHHIDYAEFWSSFNFGLLFRIQHIKTQWHWRKKVWFDRKKNDEKKTAKNETISKRRKEREREKSSDSFLNLQIFKWISDCHCFSMHLKFHTNFSTLFEDIELFKLIWAIRSTENSSLEYFVKSSLILLIDCKAFVSCYVWTHWSQLRFKWIAFWIRYILHTIELILARK